MIFNYCQLFTPIIMNSIKNNAYQKVTSTTNFYTDILFLKTIVFLSLGFSMIFMWNNLLAFEYFSKYRFSHFA